MILKSALYYFKKTLIPLSIILLFVLFASRPFPWNETIENTFIDLHFRIRGERNLSDDIALVYIGAEDVEALGGWPITRDYYGYLTHVLNRLEAKVIGVYLLFDSPDPRYPEYDQILANFFQKSDNVCLTMAFYRLTKASSAGEYLESKSPNLLVGQDSILPLQKFREQVAGFGFSNLSDELIQRKVPLVALQNEKVVPSFGCELARLYLNPSQEVKLTSRSVIFKDLNEDEVEVPVDQSGQLRLNHFGDIDRVQALGLVDLLQIYEQSPDSLNFKGKIVIVDVTAPGIPILQSTPLAPALPASLIHATVVENILQQNYLRAVPGYFHGLSIAVLVLAAWIFWQFKSRRLKSGLSLSLLVGYWLLTYLLFSRFNLIVPLFYPTISLFTTIGVAIFRQSRRRQSLDSSVKSLLEEQISIKERQLVEARTKMEAMQSQIQNESTLSEQSALLAEQRKQTIVELEKQLRDLQTYIQPEPSPALREFAEIIHAEDSKMSSILDLVSKIGSDNIPVLILGETGTGKELIARAIHQSSERKDKPFIAVNCGALSETLLESELFGHEKGSFTGAHSRRKGRFELADGGTIFLDEITETTPTFQARLLRILQEGAFERLGGEHTLKVDVRVIAATNQDIQKAVEDEQFRADLFYRLNGFPITLPALRERPQDIPLLSHHFLKKHDYPSVKGLSDQAVSNLQAYSWPGNVRELENVIRRAAILVQSEGREIIQMSDLPDEIQKSTVTGQQKMNYKSFEEQILDSLRTLQFSRSAISQTAQALGNRDRGTITEYFRGICFQHFVQANFDLDSAVHCIAATDSEQILTRVKNKIDEYLNNLFPLPESSEIHELGAVNLPSQFKGLPKKYHPYLQQVIDHLRERASW